MPDRIGAAAPRLGPLRLRIAGRHPLLAVVARIINRRSRLTGIATGDQAIFVAREAFEAVGGFRSAADGRHRAFAPAQAPGRPFASARRSLTSGRRWEKTASAHHSADVAAAAGFFLAAPSRLCSRSRRVQRGPSAAQRRRPAMARARTGGYCCRRATRAPTIAHHARPNAGHRGRPAPVPPYRTCPHDDGFRLFAPAIMPTARTAIPVSRRPARRSAR